MMVPIHALQWYRFADTVKEMTSHFLALSASMPELLIAYKTNSLDEVIKASRIGKKKKFHNLIRTDMNDMINEKDKEFANDHRFLVNEKFKVMMAFMEQLAVNYQKCHYGPRNEWDCTLGHASTACLSFFLSL